MELKLSDDNVLEVFRGRLRGATLVELGTRFGVHWMYVQRVVKGECRRGAHPGHPDRLACVAAELAKLAATRKRLRALPARLGRAVRDFRRGHSLRSAAARNRIGWSTLRRELVRRGVPRGLAGTPTKFILPKKGR